MDLFEVKNKYVQLYRSKQIFANSVNTDEMGHNEPSHQDLHCLPFCHSVSISNQDPYFTQYQ